MQPVPKNSFYTDMTSALNGALTLGGLTSDWLDQFAYDAELNRQKLISLQEFVKKEWAANGQTLN